MGISTYVAIRRRLATGEASAPCSHSPPPPEREEEDEGEAVSVGRKRGGAAAGALNFKKERKGRSVGLRQAGMQSLFFLEG